jgi:hypothetical protein
LLCGDMYVFSNHVNFIKIQWKPRNVITAVNVTKNFQDLAITQYK